MATIKHNEKEEQVDDGSNIKAACEALGVPFGCRSGYCGTCKITILSGSENLSPLTPEEDDMGRDLQHRLACQCKISKGIVEIKIDA
ncbi:TPA: (2Fe-2S)-binding protein [Candidatus Woesearchaeota archaeon]|nr:ferredoxin [archaeon]HIJ11290.1 (2Fe-2S)-binding protein [Candidatus Woesearchaeota archaeon]